MLGFALCLALAPAGALAFSQDEQLVLTGALVGVTFVLAVTGALVLLYARRSYGERGSAGLLPELDE